MANLIDNSSAFLQPIDYENRTDDEQVYINALIDVASEALEVECNRIFAPITYAEETHSGSGQNSIFVFNPPIRTLTSVVYVGDTENTTILATNFSFDTNIGEIRWKVSPQITQATLTFGKIFTEGFKNILINYAGGFATVPKSIQMLAAQLVIEQFDPETAKNAVKKEKLGQFFIELNTAKFQSSIMENKNIIGRYKIHAVSEGLWP